MPNMATKSEEVFIDMDPPKSSCCTPAGCNQGQSIEAADSISVPEKSSCCKQLKDDTPHPPTQEHESLVPDLLVLPTNETNNSSCCAPSKETLDDLHLAILTKQNSCDASPTEGSCSGPTKPLKEDGCCTSVKASKEDSCSLAKEVKEDGCCTLGNEAKDERGCCGAADQDSCCAPAKEVKEDACCGPTKESNRYTSSPLTMESAAAPKRSSWSVPVKEGSCCKPVMEDSCCDPPKECCPSVIAAKLDPCCTSSKNDSCNGLPKEDSCCGPPKADKRRPVSLFAAQPALVSKKSGCCASTNDECGGQKPPDLSIDIGKDDMGHWKSACFQVDGMTCTGCENTLNAALQAHPSMTDVKSNMFLSKAELLYNPTTLTTAEIINIIQSAGFSAQILHAAAGNQARFDISRQGSDGFNSEKDRAVVTTTMRNFAGIVSVDTTDHPQSGVLADVEFDPEVTGTRDIARVLRSQGFIVELAKEDGDGAKKAKNEMRRVRSLLILSVLLVIPVVFLAFIFPDAGTSHLAPDLSARNLALFLLTSPIQLYVGAPIYRGAWNGLVLSRELNMDSLVVLSTSCAYFYSTIATVVAMASPTYDAPEVFFETSAILMTLIILGRYMQALARGRAADALSKLKDLQSPTAHLVTQDAQGNELVEQIESGYLQRRDIIKILPSERIPADGIVVNGTADVDESNMTGESVPVGKGVSDEVLAGSINLNGTLLVRITRIQSESKLNDITKLVEQAQSSRAPSQALADKIATWFTPFVIALGLTTYLVWLILGLQGKVDTTRYPSGVLALTYAVAVLVVSCPCAIALAVPTVMVVGAGVGARHGILVKEGGVFEEAARVTHVVFDKTGTLTEGRFQVVDCLDPGDNVKDSGELSLAYDLAATAASNSEHPLSLAVALYCANKGSSQSLDLEESTAYPGFGISCRIQDQDVRVGKVAWAFEGAELSPRATEFLTNAQRLGHSIVAVASYQTPLLLFALADGPRSEAGAVVNHLKSMGLQVHVISGDHQAAVHHIAGKLGIDPAHAIGDCTPSDKLTRIVQLQSKGHVVAFCGDGTNDAPVLAQAQVGVALGAAGTSGVAIATAKVVLLTNDLRGMVITIDLARQVMNRIRINFGWAFLYNLFVIPLAAGCFVPLMEGVRIPPALAGLGELVSVMPVLAFALLLKRYRVYPSLAKQT